MKKLFGFIMVGLAFTALQVATAQAQVTAPGGDSEVERADMTQGGVAGEDKGGDDGRRDAMADDQNNDNKDAGMHTSANSGEKRKQDHNTAGDMAGMKESASFGMQKKEKEPMTTGHSR